MKKDTHPEYYKDAVVTCACGETFTTGSTQKTIQVEICSKCHPFYTGKQKLVDTAGRVDKFRARAAKAGKAQNDDAKQQSKTSKKKTDKTLNDLRQLKADNKKPK